MNERRADRFPDLSASLRACLETLPADWEVRPLGALARGPGRYGSSAPGQAFHVDWPRYVRITDIGDEGRLRDGSLASLPPADAAPFRLQEGDLLFARTGATVGKSYLYDPEDGACAHAGYLIRFALDPACCAPAFVARWAQSGFFQRWVRATLRQAAQPNINAGEYAALPVPCPPLAEQQAIAGLLGAVDGDIRATEGLLAKLEHTLRSLVHELLTRGVGADGRLRDPAEEPDAFVDTPLGRLPRRFEVAPLGALLAQGKAAMRSGPFGSALLKSELVREGVPLLGIDNIEADRFVPAFRRFVSPSKLEDLRRYAVYPNDVMVTIMGTVGRACLVPGDIGRALSSKHIWTLTFDANRYLPLLACLQLNYASWVHEHFRREEQGGTMMAIRSETLRTTLLPVPPLDEQYAMLRVLEHARDRIRIERAALDRKRHLRKALLEDLVMGRVRMPAAGAA